MRWAQVLAGWFAWLIASGCSDLHVVQPPGEMRLRTGSVDEVLLADSYADLLLPYALLADQTRKEAVYRTAASCSIKTLTAIRRTPTSAAT